MVRIISTPNRMLQNRLTPMNFPLFSISFSRSFFPLCVWMRAGSAAERPTVMPSARGECSGIKFPESSAHTMVPIYPFPYLHYANDKVAFA